MTQRIDRVFLASSGKKLAHGVAVDSSGKPTTDPDEALKGAFLAFGSYKGAGLSLMIELLTQGSCGQTWLNTKCASPKFAKLCVIVGQP